MIWKKVILLIVNNIVLSLATTKKISVTFVIDDTMSMNEDISQVKYGVTSIFDAVTNSPSSIVEEFNLVTFNDHEEFGREPECLIKTLDRDAFISILSQIEVYGGGDCPEMAMSGIELGLMESLPGSYMYVFTDAIAKDFTMLEKVQNLAIKKKIQIIFIITSCPSVCEYLPDDPRYLAYYKLADATFGQVFHMVKKDVVQILAYIKETMKKRKDPLFKRTFPPGYGHEFVITVDGAMKDLLIAESGKDPKIIIVADDGSDFRIENIVDISDAMVMKLVDPKPGNYTAKVGSKSETSVVVTGESTVSFNYGFSANVEPTSCSEKETSTMPVPGQLSFLAIQLITGEECTLDSVEFIGMDDVVLMEVPLKLVDATEKLYVTLKEFLPPDVLFNIAINGNHVKSNTKLRRLSRTPVEAQKVIGEIEEMSLTMEIENGNNRTVKNNEPVKLVCNVKGYPKPYIAWSDEETGEILKIEVSTPNVPYDHRAILQIEKVTKNSTFKCKAKNTNGEINQIVKVALDPFYFNVLEKPKNIISIEYLKTEKIHSKVDANPSPTIIWKVNDEVIHTDDNYQILEDSQVLVIKQMLPKMEGKYFCVVKNDFESVLIEFQVLIVGSAPAITIDGPSVVDAEYDKPLSLICHATGYPEPKVAWYDDATGEELLSFAIPSSSNSYEYGRILQIEKVNKNAIYRCKTSNSYGEVSANVTVETSAYFVIVEAPKNIKIGYEKEDKVFCRVDAKPEAEIKWMFKDVPLGTNSHYEISADNTTLTVRDMQPSLSGYYSCVVSNKNNLTDLVFKISITGLVDPVIDKTVKKLKVLEGSVADINCKILQSKPAATFSWTFKDQYRTTFEVVEGTTDYFHIDKVTRDDSGDYMCIATNGKSKDYHVIYLSVEFPPTIEKPNERVKAEDGETVTLQCFTQGEPAPKVSWFLNGDLIEANKEFKIYSDNSMSIKSSPSKAGTYNCTASNEHGTASIVTQVDYYVPVSFDLPLESTIETNVGKDENLQCIADGYPAPTIKWLFFSSDNPGQPPQVLKTAVSPASLELTNVTINQDGDYVCVASNGKSEKNMTYTVHVNGKPKILSNPTKTSSSTTIQAVVNDKLVRVPCKAIGRPTPEISWINEKGFNIAAGTVWNDVDKDGSLIIKNIEKGESVTCVAENRFGSDRKTFSIVANEYPIPANPVSEHKLKVGDAAEVSCPLPHTKVDSVRWFKGRTLVENLSEDQSLKFDSISSTNGGTYTCRVSSFTGPAQSATIVITTVE